MADESSFFFLVVLWVKLGLLSHWGWCKGPSTTQGTHGAHYAQVIATGRPNVQKDTTGVCSISWWKGICPSNSYQIWRRFSSLMDYVLEKWRHLSIVSNHLSILHFVMALQLQLYGLVSPSFHFWGSGRCKAYGSGEIRFRAPVLSVNFAWCKAIVKNCKKCPEYLLVTDCDCDGNRHSTAIDIHVHKRYNVGGAMMTLDGCTKKCVLIFTKGDPWFRAWRINLWPNPELVLTWFDLLWKVDQKSDLSAPCSGPKGRKVVSKFNTWQESQQRDMLDEKSLSC